MADIAHRCKTEDNYQQNMNDIIKQDWELSANLINDIRDLINHGRQQAYAAINQTMVKTYWQIGQRIVEEEQAGKERAEYGKQLLIQLSDALTKEFGKGFSTQNLYYFRQFYLTFPEIFHTPCGILTWSHYRRLLSVSNQEARDWYLQEAASQMWSYATLNRNISTQYYERLLISQDKEPVRKEMTLKTRDFDHDKLEFVKNPVVAEFLGMSSTMAFIESDLEKALLDNLQKFLLELGKSFTFVGRQKLIRTETEHYYVDLVFYNYLLKCFVLVDLKAGKVTHQDVGQMKMYVNIFDREVRPVGDNPTLGIVLASDTNEDIARYLLDKDDNVFMSKYMLVMPTQEELRREIEQQKAIFALQQQEKKDNDI